MQFNQEQDPASYRIRSYQSGRIDITTPVSSESDDAGRHLTLTESFIMTPEVLIRDWAPNHPDQLQLTHLEILLELRPEVVLLGTGARLVFPSIQVTAELMAACRTYNILMHEGRRVAVALMQ